MSSPAMRSIWTWMRSLAIARAWTTVSASPQALHLRLQHKPTRSYSIYGMKADVDMVCIQVLPDTGRNSSQAGLISDAEPFSNDLLFKLEAQDGSLRHRMYFDGLDLGCET